MQRSRESFTRRTRIDAALALGLLAIALVLAAPRTAGAVGELTFDECFGSAAGCVTVPGDPLAHADGVAVSATTGAVYVMGGGLSHFFSGAGGNLSYDGCIADEGKDSCTDDKSAAKPFNFGTGLAVNQTRGAVYTTSEDSNLVTQLFTEPGGQLVYGGCIAREGAGGFCGLDTSGTESLASANAVAASPDGSSVYVASTGATINQGYLVHLFVEPGGQIRYDGCVSASGDGGHCLALPGNAHELDDADAVAVAPDNRAVYVTGSERSVVSGFIAAAPDGQLEAGNCVSVDGLGGHCEDAPGNVLESVHGVAASPDGHSLYVAGEAVGTVSRLSVEAAGHIRWRECISSSDTGGICTQIPGSGNALRRAGAVAVSGDGQSVYVLGSAAVSAFSVGAEGKLSYQGCYSSGSVEGCTVLPGTPIVEAGTIAVSPNGASVYATSFGASTVLHFSRRLPATVPGPGGGPGTGPGGGPGPSTPGPGAQVPTAAQLKAGLFSQLLPGGAAANIAKLLKKRAYAYSFSALTAGTLSIAWYYVPRGARVSRSGKTKPQPVRIATGHTTFPAAGRKSFALTLTAAGRRMLEHTRSLALAARGSFTVPHGKPVVAIRVFKLRR